jgi:hypothetical protein
MTEQKAEEIIPRRYSGQDIGNPNPPSLIEVPHEGHKADSESWMRTSNKQYFKKRAKQMVDKGSTDRKFLDVLTSRRG